MRAPTPAGGLLNGAASPGASQSPPPPAPTPDPTPTPAAPSGGVDAGDPVANIRKLHAAGLTPPQIAALVPGFTAEAVSVVIGML